jgi:RNA polymerase sigma-70 factor (ECF subfamily)
MSEIPDTRQSLIQRVRSVDDSAAWSEFASIYRPAVIRFALRRGLQPADAEDVAQRVFLATARAMGEWEADESRGSFRAWLLTVTKNAVINAVQRQPKAKASGGTSAFQKMSALDDGAETEELQKALEWEYQRAEFRRAAEDVRPEFHAATWAAFWETAVKEREIAAVAKELQKSVGTVYAARSRVLRRIKQRVEQLTRLQEGSGT